MKPYTYTWIKQTFTEHINKYDSSFGFKELATQQGEKTINYVCLLYIFIYIIYIYTYTHTHIYTHMMKV